MWGTIANLKENLNKIALDVHDDEDEEEEEELKIYDSRSRENSSVSDRRNSRRFAHSESFARSPVSNGTDSLPNTEIEQYKAEIKRLQDSEAEIKALSVNYAALLKEKEGQVSRLNRDNALLKQNLDSTNTALHASRNESSRASANSNNAVKGTGDLSPNRQHKLIAQGKKRNGGTQMQNGVYSRQNSSGDGVIHAEGKEKELADLLQEKTKSLEVLQATHELQTKQFKMELEKEREKLTTIQLELQGEQKLNRTFREELKSLKLDKEKTSMEMSKMRQELNDKLLELKQLQKLNKRQDGDADHAGEHLKRVIARLEKENNYLKLKKNELETALENSRKSLNEKMFPVASDTWSDNASGLKGKGELSESISKREELERSLHKLDKELKETQSERDKARQELSRLKQHLLDKENEESEKMDEDSKIIEELREINEYQRAQVLHLEKALKQAIASQEEIKMINNNEMQKSKELIDDLNKKLANCMKTLDAKNIELVNLQTALGQYFAEIEAKEHVEGELVSAREESAKLSGLLIDAEQQKEVLKREKEEILAKLSQAEKVLAEGKGRVNKLEEDNAKLRRAVEQSMTRLNRMSVDSDFLVDRRIVIKLLVTYFQRNHSKEVLDLMVRMLGFSEEDKQRIGMAQQGRKGVVRGVLGLPGRLVGGILGGGSEAHANMASDNQSFADLWVDFLLKETQERERRELADNMGNPPEGTHGTNPIAGGVSLPAADQNITNPASTISGLSGSNRSPGQNISSHFDSEFSTVPLSSSSDSTTHISRQFPRY